MQIEKNNHTDSGMFNSIMREAPTEEPARQYYFIAQIKALLKQRFEADAASGKAEEKYGAEAVQKMLAGHFYGFAQITTFGCQMNARDSEKIAGILSELGYAETEDEEHADFVLFNTCTIRENANEHLYGRLGRLKQSKLANPDKIIALCGCMMQETDEVEKIRKKYPYVDLIFGTHNFYTFAELLFHLLAKRSGEPLAVSDEGNEVIADSVSDLEKTKKLRNYTGAKNEAALKKLAQKPVVSVWQDTEAIIEELPSERKFPFKQGVNIMFGCNNFCSYCIVPYVRGREKSRKPEDILREVERLGADGVKEIMLLGQNVNSYGKTLAEPMSFAALLREVDALADSCGIERIRFMTSHPKDLSEELVRVMAEGRHICHQFHLPLQSGSDRILKRMNRHYDSEMYLRRARLLQEAMPDISISTDIIVGFPGESEEDFRMTLDMVEAVRYDAAYTFIYSKREGTPAARYEEQIAEDIVKERFDRLLAVQNRIAEENCAKLVGKTLPVLFEEVNAHDERLITGRLENNSVVHVAADRALIGTIADVRLTEAHGFYYSGALEGANG